MSQLASAKEADKPATKDKTATQEPPLSLPTLTVSILPETPVNLPAPQEFELTKRIHALIVKNAKEGAPKRTFSKLSQAHPE